MFLNFLKRKKKTPLVFIIGAPRTGTTWLWGLLTSHPDVIPLVREDFNPSMPSVIDGKIITSETGAFINHDDHCIHKVVQTKMRNNPGKMLVEKTPLHILHMGRILKLFPGAKILFIARDPRFVISSMLHSKFFNFAESLEDAIVKHKSYIDAAEPFLDNPKLYFLKYENLLAGTEKRLGKIFNFIGLSKKNVKDIIKENHKKCKVQIKGVLNKENIGKIDSYKKDLTKDQIKKIENELAEIMARFNYN